MKLSSTHSMSRWYPHLGLAVILLAAYGRLLLHPELHTACPENDIWNLPIRWSVLSALRQGHLPLWNPDLAFGFPWLATWQTETFYPGTLLFKWLGLSFWNYSGILHLALFSLGILCFMRSSEVKPFGAFLAAALAFLTPWTYNHLGSNSPTDTLAWIPWVFYGLHEILHDRPYGRLKLGIFLTLQILAGYPQIILYTWLGCFLFLVYHKGLSHLKDLALPFLGALLVTAVQWLPSAEYFLFDAARLPAVASDPNMLLPLGNLRTLWNDQALSVGGVPDYVLSPTFFYFNLYAGWLPLILLLWGLVSFKKIHSDARFFFLAFAACLIWMTAPFPSLFRFLHLPFPSVLEPAKSWALGNVLELFTIGFLAADLLDRAGRWRWALAALAILNLLVPIWIHPVERNLLPGDPYLEAQAAKLRTHLGTGRALVLADNETYGQLHSPLPTHEKEALFKHFTPNSNLYVSLPVANFNGSTLPSWGDMDAGFYFKYCFPYPNHSLLDLLGVDLLLVTKDQMPSHFEKLSADGPWTLWKNPSSLGGHFWSTEPARQASRKEAFAAFASEKAKPLKDLFLSPTPISQAPQYSPVTDRASDKIISAEGKEGYLVITQNATPGWRAWVDGKPVPLFLADGIFQAIPISRGSRQIRLSYEPASFRFGLFLSLISLAALMVGARSFKTNRFLKKG